VLAQGTTDLQQELALCTKYLNLDSRNFHCWNYRRFVVSRIGMHASLEGELAFTLEKINQDFSNYSAWHYRSVLLPQRFEEGDALDAMLDAEFELVQQAFYTEPEDQSAWLYHRWLLGRVALPGFRLPGVSLGMSDLAHGFGVAVDLKETTGAVKGELSTSPAPPKERHVVRQRAVFERELASCLELLELEPHCKWVLLTSAVLLSGVQACRTTSHTPDDEQHDEAAARITDIFVTLESLDPLRSQYYSSIRRKLLDRFHSI
jgi:geranylgeranyl transferase type-2 subunit alpha